MHNPATNCTTALKYILRLQIPMWNQGPINVGFVCSTFSWVKNTRQNISWQKMQCNRDVQKRTEREIENLLLRADNVENF